MASAKLGNLYSEDMKGFSSFEADSLPSFDEFDSDAVQEYYYKERLRSSADAGRSLRCPFGVPAPRLINPQRNRPRFHVFC